MDAILKKRSIRKYKELLNLPASVTPLSIIPVGYPD